MQDMLSRLPQAPPLPVVSPSGTKYHLQMDRIIGFMLVCFLKNNFSLPKFPSKIKKMKDSLSWYKLKKAGGKTFLNDKWRLYQWSDMQPTTLPFTHLPPGWISWTCSGTNGATRSHSLGLCTGWASCLCLLLPHPALFPWLIAIIFANQQDKFITRHTVLHSLLTHCEASHSLHLCPPGVLHAMSWYILCMCAWAMGLLHCERLSVRKRNSHSITHVLPPRIPHFAQCLAQGSGSSLLIQGLEGRLQWALPCAASGRTRSMSFL